MNNREPIGEGDPSRPLHALEKLAIGAAIAAAIVTAIWLSTKYL